SGVSRFMSGRFITMMFGLCGAALAIYHTAKPEHKKVVGGFMLSPALPSFLTGITETLEFRFLFCATYSFCKSFLLCWVNSYLWEKFLTFKMVKPSKEAFFNSYYIGCLKGKDKQTT
ncbi:hypothetical protein EY01_15730, partial [Staphylococcus aureus]